jgi:predicted DNA-binding transcriptional regulator AlpA
MKDRRQLLTAPEIMEVLRIKARQTLYRYEAEGLPFHQIKPGGRKLYDPAEVLDWIGSRWSRQAPGQTA